MPAVSEQCSPEMMNTFSRPEASPGAVIRAIRSG